MHITWILSSKLTRDAAGNLTSPMASTRYRVLQPAEHLAAGGHRIDLIQAGLPPHASELAEPLAADVVVVSKGLFEGSVALAQRAKSFGAHLGVDLCDDHFETQFRGTYLALCQLADSLFASTPAMAEAIRRHTGRSAAVISDPYEAPVCEPRFLPRGTVRLAWFGHPANFDTLAAMSQHLPAFLARYATELSVVTQPTVQLQEFLQQWQNQFANRLQVRLIPWSPKATWDTLREADAVVIPSFPESAKLVKSPNRVVETLRMGRFVAAYPLPAYQPFAEFAWLGQNVLAGVAWAIDHPRPALAKIKAGQEYVAGAFAPARIAAQWADQLGRCVGRFCAAAG